MNPRILFVDDEELIVTMAAGYLSRTGYSVTTATNVRDALAAFESEVFDMVVTDLMMEPEDGLVLYHELKAIDSTIPVLLMSGLGENEQVKPLVEAGEAHFLSKPFGIRELSEAVRSVLDG